MKEAASLMQPLLILINLIYLFLPESEIKTEGNDPG